MRPVRLRPAARLAAVIAVSALAVAGCANADPDPSSPQSVTTNALRGVKVSGEAGKKPALTLTRTPTSLTTTGTVVVEPGDGATVASGQRVTVDYLLVNGKDGKEADSSFGKTPQNFIADPKRLMPGLANSLIGQKVGARILAGIAPKDGFGEAGNPSLGFGKDDALLFVLDIKAAATPLTKATGEQVSAKAGLPTVKDNGAQEPTITIPKDPPPSTLQVQPLIKGTGPRVESGNTISAAYVGVIYGSGRVFDSSYKTGRLLQSPVGVKGLVPGFDKGLVGQTVGSRVLLVIPPKEGYGKRGNPQAGIKSTDTLVFVVDILDAYQQG
ncbi:MAG: FKBP-type peptidyl-prolyl cis-trans isomerase [Angustibacter sp.]